LERCFTRTFRRRPIVLEVHGKKILRLKDVAIGEVWVASGQSNMTYALAGAANAAEEVPKANDPDLRFFTVPKRIAVEGQLDTLPADWGWKPKSTGSTIRRFEASCS
jgi:sialate O-acetylesterase